MPMNLKTENQLSWMIGVNGRWKMTTSVGKLAGQVKRTRAKNVILAAADTSVLPLLNS